MTQLIALLLLFSISVLHADISAYFKKIKNKSEINKFENIDLVYLVNVDTRIDRLQKSIQQLEPYGIYPCCLSTINSHNFTLEALNQLGVTLSPEMTTGESGLYYSLDEYNHPMPIRENMYEYGRTYFNVNHVGLTCVMSHLSILQDAYDSNYETVWILEDDFEIIRDPRIIPDLIDEMDRVVGKGNWDILFTDRDFRDPEGKYMTCACAPSPGRPNYQVQDATRFTIDTPVSNNLRQIGARFGTTSMIVRRSGMEKILNFVKLRGVFLSLDQDIFLTEKINLFTVREDVISNALMPMKTQKRPRKS